MTVHRVWKTCIGLGDDRQASVFTQLLQERSQLVRLKRAVQADSVSPQALQSSRHGSHRTAGKGSPALVERHGDENRQFRAVLHGLQRGFRFIKIRHGLNNREVRSGFFTADGHICKQLPGPLERKTPHRFQQRSQGSDVQSGELAWSSLGLCKTDSGCDDLLEGVSRPGQLEFIGTEGIGVDDLTSGVEIVPVNGTDQIRIGKIQKLGMAAGRQSFLLQDGPHGAVQQDDLVL